MSHPTFYMAESRLFATTPNRNSSFRQISHDRPAVRSQWQGFIFGTKLHGNTRMAMISRLIVQAEQTNWEELMAVALGELADEKLPRWNGRIDATKDQYFHSLK